MPADERLASPLPGRAVSNPLSLSRVDSAVARSAAGFGVAFLAQSVPVMLEQLPNMQPWWSWLLVPALAGSLALAVATAVLDRHVKLAQSAVALVYLVALATWPFAVVETRLAPESSYWLYFLLTIATAMATIGLDVRIATAYVLVAPALYALIRITPAGGGVTLTQAVLDSVYSVILGGVITIIVTMLRAAATTVDRAQQTALARYSHAVRAHAMELERVQVDAIVHDSVLTTLLTAGRASGPEAKALAATMAGDAIGHLRDAASVAPDADGEVAVAVVAGRIADAAATMSQPFAVRTTGADGSIPISVAEALYSAAVQAMVNSLQHAGVGVPRWAEVHGRADGVTVTIGDRGAGFDVDAVPTERLGVRVSILERVTAAGGAAQLRSSPGVGTVVTLAWRPAPEGSS
jgi:signal transduction histidine kinase